MLDDEYALPDGYVPSNRVDAPLHNGIGTSASSVNEKVRQFVLDQRRYMDNVAKLRVQTYLEEYVNGYSPILLVINSNCSKLYPDKIHLLSVPKNENGEAIPPLPTFLPTSTYLQHDMHIMAHDILATGWLINIKTTNVYINKTTHTPISLIKLTSQLPSKFNCPELQEFMHSLSGPNRSIKDLEEDLLGDEKLKIIVNNYNPDNNLIRHQSAINLYFMSARYPGSDGILRKPSASTLPDRFKVTVPVFPYFYISLIDDSLIEQTVGALKVIYAKVLYDITVVIKEDLEKPDHLSGVYQNYIKLFFYNLPDFNIVKNDMGNYISYNKNKLRTQSESSAGAVYGLSGSKAHFHQLSAPGMALNSATRDFVGSSANNLAHSGNNNEAGELINNYNNDDLLDSILTHNKINFEDLEMGNANNTNTLHTDSTIDDIENNHSGVSAAQLLKSQYKQVLENIIDIREYDIPLHVRFGIDHNVIAGNWYNIAMSYPSKQQSSEFNSNFNDILTTPTTIANPIVLSILHNSELESERPKPLTCSFDIETAKPPLKFPSPETDGVMMISIVFSGGEYDAYSISNSSEWGNSKLLSASPAMNNAIRKYIKKTITSSNHVVASDDLSEDFSDTNFDTDDEDLNVNHQNSENLIDIIPISKLSSDSNVNKNLRGILICNREYLSEDLDDFVYNPFHQDASTANLPGSATSTGSNSSLSGIEFKVINTLSEFHLFQEFFRLLFREKPQVHVSFNGDGFDFHYIEVRIRKLIQTQALLGNISVKNNDASSTESICQQHSLIDKRIFDYNLLLESGLCIDGSANDYLSNDMATSSYHLVKTLHLQSKEIHGNSFLVENNIPIDKFEQYYIKTHLPYYLPKTNPSSNFTNKLNMEDYPFNEVPYCFDTANNTLVYHFTHHPMYYYNKIAGLDNIYKSSKQSMAMEDVNKDRSFSSFEYTGSNATSSVNFGISTPIIHLDCYKWVKRDSYLPQGSQNLKAVTKIKLKYNPVELDPEKMLYFAEKFPKIMGNYSVSDVYSTYYIYQIFVFPFIFSMNSIIPLNPDEILRKGTGTLCETLLMKESYQVNIIFPNKSIATTSNSKSNKVAHKAQFTSSCATADPNNPFYDKYKNWKYQIKFINPYQNMSLHDVNFNINQVVPLPINLEPLKGSYLSTYFDDDKVLAYFSKFLFPQSYEKLSLSPNLSSPIDVSDKGLFSVDPISEDYLSTINNVIDANSSPSMSNAYSNNNYYLLENETYIGGHVECFTSGIFRSNILEPFNLNLRFIANYLIPKIPDIIKDYIIREANQTVEECVNFDEIVHAIQRDIIDFVNINGNSDISNTTHEAYTEYISRPLNDSLKVPESADQIKIKARPLIYHLDVAAMYPNIILTNKLQPYAVAKTDTINKCNSCSIYQEWDESLGMSNNPNKCQRKLNWNWRGEIFNTNKKESLMLIKQLENEVFHSSILYSNQKMLEISAAAIGSSHKNGPTTANAISNTRKRTHVSFESTTNNGAHRNHTNKYISFKDLPSNIQIDLFKSRLKNYAKNSNNNKSIVAQSSNTSSIGNTHNSTTVSSTKRNSHPPVKKVSSTDMSNQNRIKKTSGTQILSVNQSSIFCMRENPVYWNTIKKFRDRRYVYKSKHKESEAQLKKAETQAEKASCMDKITIYDSLQLAHKCILNSFYGYVMRKAARWYSLEMAAVTCRIGSDIIKLSSSILQLFGARILELDTDGLWVLFPDHFPESYILKFQPKNKRSAPIVKKGFSFPGIFLNLFVSEFFTNDNFFEYSSSQQDIFNMNIKKNKTVIDDLMDIEELVKRNIAPTSHTVLPFDNSEESQLACSLNISPNTLDNVYTTSGNSNQFSMSQENTFQFTPNQNVSFLHAKENLTAPMDAQGKFISQNTILFEVDGPYRAFLIPAGINAENELLKKRYCVFDGKDQTSEVVNQCLDTEDSIISAVLKGDHDIKDPAYVLNLVDDTIPTASNILAKTKKSPFFVPGLKNIKYDIKELKGFELKRRGELYLLKILQERIFPIFLTGHSKRAVFFHCFLLVDYYYRLIDSLENPQLYGDENINWVEVFELLSESKTVQKEIFNTTGASEAAKSTAVTAVRRLYEYLGIASAQNTSTKPDTRENTKVTSITQQSTFQPLSIDSINYIYSTSTGKSNNATKEDSTKSTSNTSTVGISCRYIIGKYPQHLPVSERAIPLNIFNNILNGSSKNSNEKLHNEQQTLEEKEASVSLHQRQKYFLKKWMQDSSFIEYDHLNNETLKINRIIDVEYYKQRLLNTASKLILIPSLSCANDSPTDRNIDWDDTATGFNLLNFMDKYYARKNVMENKDPCFGKANNMCTYFRKNLPPWILKKLNESKYKQKTINSFFTNSVGQAVGNYQPVITNLGNPDNLSLSLPNNALQRIVINHFFKPSMQNMDQSSNDTSHSSPSECLDSMAVSIKRRLEDYTIPEKEGDDVTDTTLFSKRYAFCSEFFHGKEFDPSNIDQLIKTWFLLKASDYPSFYSTFVHNNISNVISNPENLANVVNKKEESLSKKMKGLYNKINLAIKTFSNIKPSSSNNIVQEVKMMIKLDYKLILGPSTSIASTNIELNKWITYRKNKWHIQRVIKTYKRLIATLDSPSEIAVNTASHVINYDVPKITESIHQLLMTRPWHIISVIHLNSAHDSQIVKNDDLGSYIVSAGTKVYYYNLMVWICLNNTISHRVFLHAPKRFSVNAYTRFSSVSVQIYRQTHHLLYDIMHAFAFNKDSFEDSWGIIKWELESTLSASKYTLPRSTNIAHLYQISMDEILYAFFIQNKNKILFHLDYHHDNSHQRSSLHNDDLSSHIDMPLLNELVKIISFIESKKSYTLVNFISQSLMCFTHLHTFSETEKTALLVGTFLFNYLVCNQHDNFSNYHQSEICNANFMLDGSQEPALYIEGIYETQAALEQQFIEKYGNTTHINRSTYENYKIKFQKHSSSEANLMTSSSKSGNLFTQQNNALKKWRLANNTFFDISHIMPKSTDNKHIFVKNDNSSVNNYLSALTSDYANSSTIHNGNEVTSSISVPNIYISLNSLADKGIIFVVSNPVVHSKQGSLLIVTIDKHLVQNFSFAIIIKEYKRHVLSLDHPISLPLNPVILTLSVMDSTIAAHVLRLYLQDLSHINQTLDDSQFYKTKAFIASTHLMTVNKIRNNVHLYNSSYKHDAITNKTHSPVIACVQSAIFEKDLPLKQSVDFKLRLSIVLEDYPHTWSTKLPKVPESSVYISFQWQLNIFKSVIIDLILPIIPNLIPTIHKVSKFASIPILNIITSNQLSGDTIAMYPRSILSQIMDTLYARNLATHKCILYKTSDETLQLNNSMANTQRAQFQFPSHATLPDLGGKESSFKNNINNQIELITLKNPKNDAMSNLFAMSFRSNYQITFHTLNFFKYFNNTSSNNIHNQSNQQFKKTLQNAQFQYEYLNAGAYNNVNTVSMPDHHHMELLDENYAHNHRKTITVSFSLNCLLLNAIMNSEHFFTNVNTANQMNSQNTSSNIESSFSSFFGNEHAKETLFIEDYTSVYPHFLILKEVISKLVQPLSTSDDELANQDLILELINYIQFYLSNNATGLGANETTSIGLSKISEPLMTNLIYNLCYLNLKHFLYDFNKLLAHTQSHITGFTTPPTLMDVSINQQQMIGNASGSNTPLILYASQSKLVFNFSYNPDDVLATATPEGLKSTNLLVLIREKIVLLVKKILFNVSNCVGSDKYRFIRMNNDFKFYEQLWFLNVQNHYGIQTLFIPNLSTVKSTGLRKSDINKLTLPRDFFDYFLHKQLNRHKESFKNVFPGLSLDAKLDFIKSVFITPYINELMNYSKLYVITHPSQLTNSINNNNNNNANNTDVPLNEEFDWIVYYKYISAKANSIYTFLNKSEPTYNEGNISPGFNSECLQPSESVTENLPIVLEEETLTNLELEKIPNMLFATKDTADFCKYFIREISLKIYTYSVHNQNFNKFMSYVLSKEFRQIYIPAFVNALTFISPIITDYYDATESLYAKASSGVIPHAYKNGPSQVNYNNNGLFLDNSNMILYTDVINQLHQPGSDYLKYKAAFVQIKAMNAAKVDFSNTLKITPFGIPFYLDSEQSIFGETSKKSFIDFKRDLFENIGARLYDKIHELLRKRDKQSKITSPPNDNPGAILMSDKSDPEFYLLKLADILFEYFYIAANSNHMSDKRSLIKYLSTCSKPNVSTEKAGYSVGSSLSEHSEVYQSLVKLIDCESILDITRKEVIKQLNMSEFKTLGASKHFTAHHHQKECILPQITESKQYVVDHHLLSNELLNNNSNYLTLHQIPCFQCNHLINVDLLYDHIVENISVSVPGISAGESNRLERISNMEKSAAKKKFKKQVASTAFLDNNIEYQKENNITDSESDSEYDAYLENTDNYNNDINEYNDQTNIPKLLHPSDAKTEKVQNMYLVCPKCSHKDLMHTINNTKDGIVTYRSKFSITVEVSLIHTLSLLIKSYQSQDLICRGCAKKKQGSYTNIMKNNLQHSYCELCTEKFSTKITKTQLMHYIFVLRNVSMYYKFDNLYEVAVWNIRMLAQL